MDAVRPKAYSSQSEAGTLVLLDATPRTHYACINSHEERLTYLMRFECKKLCIGEERCAEHLVYSRFFDDHADERSLYYG
jgi:hypothetical protein